MHRQYALPDPATTKLDKESFRLAGLTEIIAWSEDENIKALIDEFEPQDDQTAEAVEGFREWISQAIELREMLIGSRKA